MAKQIFEAACPLCAASAQYYEIDHAERHYYKCPTCTKFIVTRMAEDRIRQAGGDASLSTHAIEATRDNDERVLEIRSSYNYDPEQPLKTEVVEKANYRL